MALKVFHVFQHKNGWLLSLDYAGNIEKQSALRFTFESMGTSERVFLTYTRQTEWLAGKTGQQDVMIRDVLIDMGVGFLF